MESARLEKSCIDPKCKEKWETLDQQCRELASGFENCPYCAEELTVHCSNCREAVGDMEYRYCPWCGKEFEK